LGNQLELQTLGASGIRMQPRFVPSILIVDDRPENLLAMQGLLAGMELRMLTALSGKDALRLTLKSPFALILLDVQMPDMDGYETAELLRAHPRTQGIPIIFVSAGMREDTQTFRGYEAGAVDYLVKPINPAILRSKVEVFCELARQRHQIEQQGRNLEVLVQERTAALSASLEELREANRRKEEFLATLAHELRNPLAPIRTGAYLLRQWGPPGAEAREVVDMIDRQSAQMARLVDDLLDIARIERGKISLRREWVDPAEVVQQALKACASRIQARGHRVQRDLAHPLPPVYADPVRLEQMLCNLLNNACKYTAERGEIRVAARTEDGQLLLSVADSGQGMAPEVLAHAFDLFYQAGAGGAQPTGGLGIGLTLVRRLAGLHGGTVRAISPGPGQGSEFQLRLPLQADGPCADPVEAVPLEPFHPLPQETVAPPAGGPPAAPAGTPPVHDPLAAGPPLRGKHILVVDDDPHVRQTSAMLLQAAGYQVSTAASGERGVEMALSLRPEVAVIDLGMPGLGGLEAAARIRAALRDDIRLLALTGYSREQDVAASLAAGFDRHLVKSGDPLELIRALQETCQARV
jgi:signal transduction histidine kinase